MKDFIKGKSWEDWLLYSIIALLIIGAILFAFGFFFRFTYYDDSFLGKQGTSVFKLIGNDQRWSLLTGFSGEEVPGNLFTLMGAVPVGTTAFAYCLVAIIGVSILFLVVIMFAVILILGLVIDVIIPRIKAKKEG